ncbi:hypothetical protein ONZ51_g7574 [Trametes cubensis]|uniref:Uncharacterized protein n=1 Tax=Trametes cubensis TaxID=1111947 RepID=A0AAD7TRZ4_9APHY|nr:hypothetical protein ONZ51_g7574 [Trametes cubensis]
MADQLPHLLPCNVPPRHRRGLLHIDWSKAITLRDQAEAVAKDIASLRSSTTSPSTSSSNTPDTRGLDLLAAIAVETASSSTAATRTTVQPAKFGGCAILSTHAAPPAVEARPFVFAPFTSSASVSTYPSLDPSAQHEPAQAVNEESTTPKSADYATKLADISGMLLRVASEISSLQDELRAALEDQNHASNVPSSPPSLSTPLPADAAAVEDENLVDMTNLGQNPSVQKKTGGRPRGKASQRKRTARRGKGTRGGAR